MKRNTSFFLGIVLLAAGLLISITVARLVTQGVITRLSRGNNQAAVTMTMNNRLQEMLNLSFELESKMLRDNRDDLVLPSRGIKDSLARLEYNVSVLRQLWADTVQRATLYKLTSLVNSQVDASFTLLNAMENKNSSLQNDVVNSLRSRHLGDSIYSTALLFQKEVEKNLNETLTRNSNAAAQLSRLNRLLVFVSLLSILVLATIIIRRQMRQLSLIKDLENARKTALQSVQAKDQFMANMSHEIRTPLNAIKGFGKILTQTPLNKDQQKYASIISTASENLLNIVNDILDFSKIETGNLVMKVSVFELAGVVEEVEQMFTPLGQEKELQLIFSTDRSLPAFIKSDPVRLRQILMNLLSNAIKFTNRGYVKLSVKAVEKKGNRVKVRFTVSDTGVGIPAEKLTTVFERFEQLDDSLTRQQGGTGLGLAITKQLVEALGGTIQVKSETGKGSVFTVELEFEKITTGSIPAAATDTAFITKPDLASARVLVAEDNMMNQLLVTRLLEGYQVETDIAENGEEAVLAMKRKKYDMVLMDVQMPRIDGLSATRIIRKEISTATPVIAMTAHVLPGEREKCLAAGMNDYLAKPLDEMELVDMLKKYFTVQNKKTAQADESGHTRWLNYNYLNGICNNEEEKVNRILEELGRQLPAESIKLERVIARKQVGELEKLHHYLKSTLACFTSDAAPVIVMEELGSMMQLRAQEELIWNKAKELAGSMQEAAAMLSAITNRDVII